MLVYGAEPDAVLFGTDWPISSMESYLEFMKTLAIPEKDRAKIMAGNAIELFGLPLHHSVFHTRPVCAATAGTRSSCPARGCSRTQSPVGMVGVIGDTLGSSFPYPMLRYGHGGGGSFSMRGWCWVADGDFTRTAVG